MAADAAMLDAAANGVAAGRWYRWTEATVSLGHFQEETDLDCVVPPDLPLVRRLSGGGAIVHHHEWTYALAVPRGHALAARPEQFYEAVHGELIAALGTSGVAARLRGERPTEGPDPALCFRRSDPRDVVITDADGVERKIVGSAQRRRKGAVLQHGSLLITASPYAPHVPGLRETQGITDARAAAIVRDAAVRFGRLLTAGSASGPFGGPSLIDDLPKPL
ncbi:Octanoyltransferase LipM [Planctomycetes bacterium LzC2]|uniref:Octanoyltransferase LipM n=2 Tax=Alienimonas chondri TaxID=2681879 RepID=A0ABX1V6S0_9PLAN|nr:Octanoyltransferase LipM [Alienimonas chondri]